MAKDIIASCPMGCEYQKTTGGYDNTLLLVNNEVDAGLVPIDVAEFMKSSERVVIAGAYYTVPGILASRADFVRDSMIRIIID